MREVIGHTRRGSEIWISLERIQGSIVVEELASFSEVDEEFDCICALEAFAVRSSARVSGGMAGEVLEQLSAKCGETSEAGGGLWFFEIEFERNDWCERRAVIGDADVDFSAVKRCSEGATGVKGPHRERILPLLSGKEKNAEIWVGRHVKGVDAGRGEIDAVNNG